MIGMTESAPGIVKKRRLYSHDACAAYKLCIYMDMYTEVRPAIVLSFCHMSVVVLRSSYHASTRTFAQSNLFHKFDYFEECGQVT